MDDNVAQVLDDLQGRLYNADDAVLIELLSQARRIIYQQDREISSLRNRLWTADCKAKAAKRSRALGLHKNGLSQWLEDRPYR